MNDDDIVKEARQRAKAIRDLVGERAGCTSELIDRQADLISSLRAALAAERERVARMAVQIERLREALVKAKKALEPLTEVRANVVFRDVDEARAASAAIDAVLKETTASPDDH